MAQGTISDDMMTELLDLWQQGFSATEIAQRMSMKYARAITRNMVIGKIHRHRVQQRRDNGEPVAVRVRKKAKPKPVRQKAEPSVAPVSNVIRLPVARVREEHRFNMSRPSGTLMGAAQAVVTLTGCKFPLGDTAAADFRFCNAAPVEEGRPYCRAHCAVAYNGIPAAKRRVK